MFYIGTTAVMAEEALMALARHLPPFLAMGRPLFATADGRIVTADGAETAMFGLGEGGCSAWRMLELSRGLVESTSWEYGVETARRIIRRPGDGGGGGDGDDDGPDPAPGPNGASTDAPAVVNAS